MAYQVHFSPIDYLARRVVYYKKMRSKLANSVNDQWLLNKYGKEETEKMIAKKIREIDNMVYKYNQAIEKLLNDA